MRFVCLCFVLVTAARAAPQNPLQSLVSGLGSLLGGNGRAGEVDKYQGAPYTVVSRFQGYEERRYPSQYWVCTRGTGGGMFPRLFSYISGENSRNQKIDMTVPVMIKKNFRGGAEDMCFYITKEFQSGPPSATDRRVNVVAMPAMNVLVKTIKAGYPNWDNEAATFRDELGGQSGVDYSSFYTMSYDSPWKVFNRRNEVMFRKV